MVSIDKAMGRNNTLNKLFSYVEKLQDHIEDYRIIIAHADCLPIATQFKKMLVDKYGNNLNIEFCVVNPTAGSHCGPNVVGVCFHAIHR
jgi:fatty acid-binding protein DegV